MVNWEKAAQTAVAAYLLITFALALYLLCKVWPGAPVSAECVSKDPCQPSPFWIFNHEVRLTLELRQILVAVFAGMIGNLIGSLLSFASCAGNRKLVASWLPWYVLNPFVGTGIAVLFYFVYRAGLVTSGSESFDINTYGIAAIAGLPEVTVEVK